MNKYSPLEFNLPQDNSDSVFLSLNDLLKLSEKKQPKLNFDNIIPDDKVIEYSNFKPDLDMQRSLKFNDYINQSYEPPVITELPSIDSHPIGKLHPLTFQSSRNDSMLGSLFKNFTGMNIDVEKSIELTSEIQYDTIKIFVISFAILYFLHPNLKFLNYEDEVDGKKKPKNFMIIIISLIISIAYFAASCIDLLDHLQN